MKKISYLLLTIMIFTIVCSFLGIKDVKATTEDNSVFGGGKVWYHIPQSGKGEAYGNSLDLVQNFSAYIYAKGHYSTNPKDFNYVLTAESEGIITLETITNESTETEKSNYGIGAYKITALKMGKTNVVLTNKENEAEKYTITVEVYRPEDFEPTNIYTEEVEAGVSPREDGKVATIYFLAAKRYNLPLTIYPNGENSGRITWIFNGEDIKDTSIEFAPDITIAIDKFETVENDTIKDGIFLDFEHSGVLPGKATVSINIGTEKYGTGTKTLKFYYYNPSTKLYEYQSNVEYNNGTVTLALTHCSSYVITDEDMTEDGEEENRKLDNEPKAGEESYLAIIGILTIISLAIAIKTRK